MPVYSLFGRTVYTDWTLPGVPQETGLQRVDLEVESGELPADYARASVLRTYAIGVGTGGASGASHVIHVTGNPAGYRMEFAGGVGVVVAEGGGRLWMVWPESCEPLEAMHHLLYSVMPLVLYLLGGNGLYGAALETHGSALALLGWSRVGKSSITASLAAGSGCTVLTDDYVALTMRDGDVMANPGYPWITLRPEALRDMQALDGRAPLHVGAPWMYQGDTFVSCWLEENDLAFGKSAVPLTSVYLLERVLNSGGSLAIEDVGLRDALVPTLRRAYFLDPGTQWERTARTIRTVGRLLDQADVRRVHIPKGAAPLDEVGTLILDDHVARNGAAGSA